MIESELSQRRRDPSASLRASSGAPAYPPPQVFRWISLFGEAGPVPNTDPIGERRVVAPDRREREF